MANPAPFPLLNLQLHWGLVGVVPQFFVGDCLWPSDVSYVPKTSVGESLEFVGVGLGHSPRF